MQKTNVNKTIHEGFKEFYRFCRVKNLSQSTLEYYEVVLNDFSKFLPLDNQISDITSTMIEDYILFLRKNTNLNDTSINTKLKGLRVILYYWMKLEYLEKFKINAIKVEKKLKETYTDAELKILLVKPNLNKCSFVEYRDWVIINYLLATGNRSGTICNLEIGDIDFESGYIQLRKTKNKRQQIIPLSDTLAKVLNEYLQYRNGDIDDYLFVSAYGEKLNRNSLANSIRNYNQRRGVMKTGVHLFRHTFAKKWIMNGGDIFRLQKILGHSTLDMVKEYVNIYGYDLQRDYEKFNPLERMTDKKSYIKLK
jgi:integrase/recombinase XerD